MANRVGFNSTAAKHLRELPRDLQEKVRKAITKLQKAKYPVGSEVVRHSGGGLWRLYVDDANPANKHRILYGVVGKREIKIARIMKEPEVYSHLSKVRIHQ